MVSTVNLYKITLISNKHHVNRLCQPFVSTVSATLDDWDLQFWAIETCNHTSRMSAILNLKSL